jgi:dihydroflavonol-4-reductase
MSIAAAAGRARSARRETMKRIGVTGAFGFLGANFVSALLEDRRGPAFGSEDLEIVAFASKNTFNPLFNPSEVRVERLDILDYEDMVRKFRGLDEIVHFAGRVDYRPSMRQAVWETDVLGTKNVFDAALATGVSKLLYASSICALGIGKQPEGADEGALPRADESSSPYGDPLWPTAFASAEEALAAVDASAAGDYGFIGRIKVAYFDAKLAGWELAKLYAREKGLGVVTIFPGTAIGAGDQHYSITKLVNDVWEGRLRLSFRGGTSFVDVRDFARGAILALEKGRIGEGYIIGGRDEHSLGYVQFQNMVANLARSEGWFAELSPPVFPLGLLLAIAFVAERILPNGSINEAFVLSGSRRNICSSDKARDELGYEPRASLDNAILECRRFSEDQRPEAYRPWLLPLMQRVLPSLR